MNLLQFAEVMRGKFEWNIHKVNVKFHFDNKMYYFCDLQNFITLFARNKNTI